ncbi:translocation/assembly module TamB domain-containing protein [Bordetella genomosp. 12]|uniref:Translocation and assembly module TamB C-terminal domain-containing protein n=1 Tax=Bordetella genomosp. 12 TaxID=463035 RepID=A0A261VC68_9BORD|nr:translocation/assembly module TamB domain-containing protein [Bordetella genomosp. 12]OZI71746.1 hypothetical protein CAL22_18290 [Bordetella genomosp. 12]
MTKLRAVLRHLLIWWLPGLAILAALAASFVFWLVASQTGSRLLLDSAVSMLGGEVEAIEGSVLKGLRVGRLDLTVADTRIEASNLWLDVDWSELGHRRAYVRALTADRLAVGLPASSPEDPAQQTSAGLPDALSLPVSIDVDRLAVGEFALTRAGQPLPVSVHDIALGLHVQREAAARLDIQSLRVDHPEGRVRLNGLLDVQKLAAPWPVAARLEARIAAARPDATFCMELGDLKASQKAQDEAARAGQQGAYLVTRPEVVQGAASALGGQAPGAAEADLRRERWREAVRQLCPIALSAQAQGTLEQLAVTLQGSGAGLVVDAQAAVKPLASFPLRDARLELKRDDGSGLSAVVDWESAAEAGAPDRIQAHVVSDRLDLKRLLGDWLPPAVLSAQADIKAELQDLSVLRSADLQLRIAPDSRWNKQALAGTVAAQLRSQEGGAAFAPGLPPGLRVPLLDVDLTLGKNRVRAQGALQEVQAKLALDVQAPDLAAFWPDLPGGGVALKADLDGELARHKGKVEARYTPPKPQPKRLGNAPVEARLAFEGGWAAQDGLAGWRGRVTGLSAQSAGFTLAIPGALALAYQPDAVAPAWQWQVGAAELQATFPDKQRLSLSHGGSRGGQGRWETAGRAENFELRATMLRQLMTALGQENKNAQANRVNAVIADEQRRIALDFSWDLKYAGALSGRARLARRSGDLRIPGDPPVPLGLKALQLDVTATAGQGDASRINAALELSTEKMGHVTATANTQIKGLTLDPRQPVRADISADVADLTWLSLFVGDTLEVGGSLRAKAQVDGTLSGGWNATGNIEGDKLRVVRIDDGVRLVDGTLRARLIGDRLVLDSLRFPAVLRVMPDEWRTKEWITTNPEAKGGYAEAKGEWNLTSMAGRIGVTLYRFPALQRSDRYAMVSGRVDIDIALPRISINGDITADAGWISLEILQGVPSLDDDVRVVRPGDDQKSATPIQVEMDLKVDMGPRFYITGMGLDAGLVGNLQILMQGGRLTGMGALHTRAGGIEAYGQKLRLRRGTLTFQGRLDNPILDILALRTGETVEAGVQVTGTAQRPRIDLVSYPDVSDVEKLSWLVLGRGPDSGGGDTALLLSIGTALLGGGEPLYKQFGLDDVSMRTGAIGSSGSLLPDRTVASSVNRDADADLATQFLVASKNFANGITLSVEQAMAGSETVGRASYRLAQGLSLDLKGGSVNGIELIYRWVVGE